jgi:hypothetical protein
VTRAELFLEQERLKHPQYREGMTLLEIAKEEREVREWQDRHDAWLRTHTPTSDSTVHSKRADTKKEKTRLRVQKHRRNKVSKSQHETALQG